MNRHFATTAIYAACLIATATDIFAQPAVVNPLSPEQQATFFHLPEGGAVMPLAFYDGLEVLDSQTGQYTGQTFAERIAVYGFLDDEDHQLPVGFGVVSLDFLYGLKGLSVNCAACHVGEIHYDSTRMRILGGPNLADVRWFSQDVYYSIRAALFDPCRLLPLLVRTNRLRPETVAALRRLPLIEDGEFRYRAGSAEAGRFLAELDELLRNRKRTARSPLDSETHRKLLETDRERFVLAIPPAAPLGFVEDILNNILLLFAELDYFIAQGQFPLATREGFGRLDAFGTVRFLLFKEHADELPFTAPVSVPHLWGTSQKKWLHWNNNTNSTLQRNIIQSLGLGALPANGGVNNVLVPNLHELEMLSNQISSPVWPAEVFGPLDKELVERGETLYLARCASCHEAGQVDSETGLIEYPLFTLAETGTDPNHALNFHQPVGAKPFAKVLGGRARQLQTWYFQFRDPENPVPPETQILWSGGPARLRAVWRDPLASGVDAPVYAGLPLAGVWATAPYLHNNSVPTLRDLLKPASERPQIFRVGHREYDPVDVGYTQPDDVREIPQLERFDTREPGNSNTGHDGAAFGADGLTNDDVEALLEYLKSL
jgi:hypothetical protein